MHFAFAQPLVASNSLSTKEIFSTLFRFEMLDIVAFQEGFKVKARELRTIVCDDVLRLIVITGTFRKP